MLISIERFGPIKRFEYDLSKDLIVTYGDNNIGKSYSMQIVYLVLKNLIETFSDRSSYFIYSNYHYHSGVDKKSYLNVEKIVNEFAESSEQLKDITTLISDIALKKMEDSFLEFFNSSCHNTFGNYDGLLEHDPKIMLKCDKYNININLKENKLSGDFSARKTYIRRVNKDYHKSRKSNGKYYIYYCKDTSTTISLIMAEIKELVDRFYFRICGEIGNVYFLPASRSGIYSGMSAFSSIVAELSRNKAMLTKKIELPGISEPISDYFLMLSGIRASENERLSSFYKQIELEILKGTVRFNKKRNTLVYEPKDVSHEFEMTEVSSMVSEISPIVAFLKYIIHPAYTRRYTRYISKKAIVFIEEPEAHLHPKNQLALIEIFSQMHKKGIKLIMSSHSNYIFNKLNNLLLAKKITSENYSPIILENTSSGNMSRHLFIDELGVQDENFVDVSEELYDEREEIIEHWNSEVYLDD